MIKSYKDMMPEIHSSCYISETADIIGNVILEKDVNVWFGSVIRGDENYVKVGKGTNIQDNCTLHIARDFPCILGENVTVGHRAIVHACTIGDRVLVGMGAIIMDGAVVRSDVIIGAGALVPPGRELASGWLYVGTPAKAHRELSDDEY